MTHDLTPGRVFPFRGCGDPQKPVRQTELDHVALALLTHPCAKNQTCINDPPSYDGSQASDTVAMAMTINKSVDQGEEVSAGRTLLLARFRRFSKRSRLQCGSLYSAEIPGYNSTVYFLENYTPWTISGQNFSMH